MKDATRQEPLLEKRAMLQGLLLSLIVAAVSFIVTILLLAETDYIYALDKALENGRGPYEVGAILSVSLLCLFYRAQVWDVLKRAFRSTEYSVADTLLIALTLWGFGPWSSIALPAIERSRLQHVNILVQVLVVIGLGWVVPRAAYLAYRSKTHKPLPNKPHLFSDRPIDKNTPDQDLIGRSNVVGQIASAITDYSSEDSFVIALTGEWGTGKTSVVNMVKHEMEQEVIFVEFDPWLISVGYGRNLDAILLRFFDALENALKPHTFRPNINRLLGKYQKAISPFLKEAPISLDFPIGDQDADLQTIRHKLNCVFRR